ncbi:MAG TPA: GNAT family N-acetyltransferase [Actinobacteria bacterium]|nr:GNAT family N-acetyltransferase [Actinomycetota bacterium]
MPVPESSVRGEIAVLDSVADVWPVFGLLIQTPRLRLRLPREDELCELARAARVIAGPGEPQLHLRWMYEPSPGMERQFLQRYWRALAHWKPDSWHLPLAIYLNGRPIGIQDMWANDFPRIRSVGTGSWISRSEQGHGYGTEARTAVLELAFGHLSAEEACTEYLDGNHASESVSRKLGYADNGQHLVYREDTGLTTEYRLRLDRQTWRKYLDESPCVITGIELCLPMFGLDSREQDQRHVDA